MTHNASGTSSQAIRPVEAAIYLDNHALTPVDPRVAEAVRQEMLCFRGNANSADHVHGEWAARRLRSAAAKVGGLFGVHAEDVRFTGSATDALRLALAHAVAAKPGAPLRAAVSVIEHPALLDMVRQAEGAGAIVPTWLACDDQARVPPEEIERALDAGCELVALIAANNEVGTIQPMAEVAELVQAQGAALLIDASQAAGHIAIDNRVLAADYLVISGHKLYGPSGVGALVGEGISEAKWQWPAGGHEPTPNLAGAAGLAEACRLRQLEMTRDEASVRQLRDLLLARLFDAVPDLVLNGDPEHRLAGNLHVSARGAPNDQVVAQLRGAVSISTGAACASGADAPSHVLRAMCLPAWRQESALRIGVGKFNTSDDIDVAADAIAEAIQDVRRG
jgi:cysteine desulfurase